MLSTIFISLAQEHEHTKEAHEVEEALQAELAQGPLVEKH